MTSTKHDPMNTLVKLAADAVANNIKLMTCARHLFDFGPYTGHKSVKFVACMRCTGRMATDAAVSYIEGYLSTGRPLADVAAHTTALRLAPKCLCPRCEGKSAPGDPRAWPEGACSLCLSVGNLPRASAVEWLNNRSVKGSA